METALAPNVSLRGQVGRFILHYFEMCIPMCIGFAVADLVYFWAAELLGYAEHDRAHDRMDALSRNASTDDWEMSATMPILAFILVMLGWLGVVPMGDLALLEHGLMMPVMLVPMLLRPGLYAQHMHHVRA